GGMISSVRDQLAFVEAELDADAGSKGTLRPAMRLSQESQLERQGDNESLSWQIDSAGRYGQTGGTAGFRAFVGFDPKTRRGLVILAATRTSAIDTTATQIFRMLANEDIKPPAFPDAAAVAAFAGTYNFRGLPLTLVAAGKRLYVQDPSAAAKYRMVPITDHEFWVEALRSIVVFEKDGATIKRAIFILGNGENQLSAPRCPDTGCPTQEPTAPPPATTPPTGKPPASGGR
ncbi:MAG TPA: hypothetical protein VFV99_17455, partial [Kofleriaceae bacterium]|nr:hypothetical protein [Kofleriaceae bacterium]